MLAVDFSTEYLAVPTSTQLRNLYAAGYTHAIIGLDTTPHSIQVARAFISQGFTWDAYRVLYPGIDPIDQIGNAAAAIHATAQTNRDLPGFLWLDIEAEPTIPTQAEVLRATEALEQQEMYPWDSLVRAGIYSGKWVWDMAGWGDWSALAEAGYSLWMNARQAPWAGWTPDHIAGYQTDMNQGSFVGNVDFSLMKDRYQETFSNQLTDLPTETTAENIVRGLLRSTIRGTN